MCTQDSSDPIQRFAQNKRPQSAPAQRPDQPESRDGPKGTPTGTKPNNRTGLADAKAGGPARRVGTANQGYPVHRLMPSDSAAQLYEEVDRSQRNSGFRPRPLHMPVGTENVRSGGPGGDGVSGSGSRHRPASVTSSNLDGGYHASTESLRLARMSSSASTEVEVRSHDPVLESGTNEALSRWHFGNIRWTALRGRACGPLHNRACTCGISGILPDICHFLPPETQNVRLTSGQASRRSHARIDNARIGIVDRTLTIGPRLNAMDLSSFKIFNAGIKLNSVQRYVRPAGIPQKEKKAVAVGGLYCEIFAVFEEFRQPLRQTHHTRDGMVFPHHRPMAGVHTPAPRHTWCRRNRTVREEVGVD